MLSQLFILKLLGSKTRHIKKPMEMSVQVFILKKETLSKSLRSQTA